MRVRGAKHRRKKTAARNRGGARFVSYLLVAQAIQSSLVLMQSARPFAGPDLPMTIVSLRIVAHCRRTFSSQYLSRASFVSQLATINALTVWTRTELWTWMASRTLCARLFCQWPTGRTFRAALRLRNRQLVISQLPPSQAALGGTGALHPALPLLSNRCRSTLVEGKQLADPKCSCRLDCLH